MNHLLDLSYHFRRLSTNLVCKCPSNVIMRLKYIHVQIHIQQYTRTHTQIESHLHPKKHFIFTAFLLFVTLLLRLSFAFAIVHFTNNVRLWCLSCSYCFWFYSFFFRTFVRSLFCCCCFCFSGARFVFVFFIACLSISFGCSIFCLFAVMIQTLQAARKTNQTKNLSQPAP